jgi:hypothetical protein
LLLSSAALLVTSRPGVVSWETLLAPYSDGTPIAGDFRIIELRRGSGNDVVLLIGHPSEPPTIEVHILPRGAWPGVRESTSFSIGYETPHSPAPERESVTEIIAQTVRARDHGLPSPGAIPLRAADPTVLPWWLEMLRGGRGWLLGTSLVLLAVIALAPSILPAACGLVWGALALGIALLGVPASSLDIGAPWTMLLGLALLIPVLRHHQLPAQDRVLVLAVTLVALGLRLALGPWGPLHVNGQGPRFIDGAARNPAEIALYGPGYGEIFAPVVALAPANPDWAIFAVNAALSAAAIPMAYAIARLVGTSRAVALAAAMILAFDPISIRTGATEAYFPVIIASALAAAGLMLAAVRMLAARRRGQAIAALVAGGLLLAQAARAHPSAWGVIACIPFIALAAAGGSFTHRMLVLLAGGAISTGLLMATSAGNMLDVLNNIRGGTLMRPLPPESLWPLVAIAAAAAAYAIGAPRRWLSIPAAVAAVLWLMTRHGYDQSWIWQQSYDRLYLTLPLIAAVALVPAQLLRHPGFAAVSTLALLGAWLHFGMPIITARTTDHLEYRWLRAQIAALPPACPIVHVVAADKRVLSVPSYIPSSRPAVAVDLRQPHTVEAALTPTACAYYVRTSLCSSAEGRPACAALEDRLALAPVARTTLPVLPSSPLLAYDRDPIETALARVTDPDGSPLRGDD